MISERSRKNRNTTECFSEDLVPVITEVKMINKMMECPMRWCCQNQDQSTHSALCRFTKTRDILQKGMSIEKARNNSMAYDLEKDMALKKIGSFSVATTKNHRKNTHTHKTYRKMLHHELWLLKNLCLI